MFRPLLRASIYIFRFTNAAAGKKAVGDERASFDNVGVGIHFASINGVIFQNHDALLSWEYYAPLVNPRLTRTYAGDWTSFSKNCQGKNSPPCSCLTKTLLLIAKALSSKN